MAQAHHIMVSDEEWSAANNNNNYELGMCQNIPIDTFPLEHKGIGPTGKS